MRKERVEVSAEMLTFVGPGWAAVEWPADWIVL